MGYVSHRQVEMEGEIRVDEKNRLRELGSCWALAIPCNSWICLDNKTVGLPTDFKALLMAAQFKSSSPFFFFLFYQFTNN